MKESIKDKPQQGSIPLYFSGLSLQGKIMLPIRKNETERKKIKETALARTQLIEAARALAVPGERRILFAKGASPDGALTLVSKKLLAPVPLSRGE